MVFYRTNEQDKIENYEKAKKDNFVGWVIHHRLELTLNGEFAHTAAELIRMGMYYERPYFELIYLTKSEHVRIHRKGIKLPEKWKKAMKKPTLEEILKQLNTKNADQNKQNFYINNNK